MLKTSVALLIATTISTFAADRILSRHEVRYEDQAFICGEIQDRGKVRRFIHAIPDARYIAEFEPRADDPLARSWLLTYRIICERGSRPAVVAGRKRSYTLR